MDMWCGNGGGCGPIGMSGVGMGGGALSAGKEALVEQVKAMQRNDPMAKEQWESYCDAQGGGIRDPSRHEIPFLNTFVASYSSGMRFESNDKVNLALLFKEGQRKSVSWKQAWAAYCAIYGAGIHDPAKHNPEFLIGFMEFLGSKGVLAFQMGGAPVGMDMSGGGMCSSMSSGGGNCGGGQHPHKRPRQMEGGGHVSSGDPMKDGLVSRIKNYQRLGPEQKQHWADYCDNSLGGIRDPARHDTSVLQQFVAMVGVP
eukprot:TRINITY_DN51051_c0_g1_i1.p1 TRINITY_DN51051_c0_g1~~TRINITY_DN51051_c0_g1_i1.p1  ORF type:complete len:256 (+),score=46.97 TRINITY_DN51051_c0_g1_i1:84-851(+)